MAYCAPDCHADEKVTVVQPAAGSPAPCGSSHEAFNSRLRLLLERAGDMVWSVDMSLCPTYVSNSVYHLLGYEPGDALRIPMAEIFSSDSYERAMKVLAEELAVDGEATCDADRTRILELDLVHKDGHLVPVEVCYSALRDAEGRPVEIMAVARNVEERRQLEERARASTESLVAALQQTVQALATLLEVRDSYTAGHQRRVADLACAIGRRLGLGEDTLRGLRLAGLIHDIGKVRVPAEILGSTRRLCDAEFEIIKMHPTVGHEVLSGIDFPWPIAEAVYQHHERLDGSGYPRGLAGDQIILEARILAVADVVEAIASDRPYRRFLGTDAALEEIDSHKAVLYDASVVDACIAAFRTDGYTMEQEALDVPRTDF